MAALLAEVGRSYVVAADDGEPGALSFSSELLAVGGRNGKRNARQVRLLDASDFTEVKTLNFEGQTWSIAFSPDGCTLAVGSQEGM